MKNTITNKIALLTLVLLLLFSTFCMAANTVDSKSTDSAKSVESTVAEEAKAPEATYEFITSDVYKFDSDITINDIIDGNVFAFGKNVSISGEIGGDVFVFGDTVTFSKDAYIHGNIFVLAQNFNFNGIAYDIYGVISNCKLSKGSIIARDIKATTSNITIEGSIKRNAYISASQLTFPEDAKDLIAGNLYYTSESELSLNKEAVTGNIEFTPETTKEVPLATRIASYINKLLSALVYSLVIVLLAIWLIPKFADKAENILKKKPLATFGIGILASIVIVAFSVAFLLITYGLGVGISFAAFTIFILALTIAKTILSMALAKLLAHKFNLSKNYQFVLLTLAVVLVITLLGFIPYIGGIISFIVNMLGIGIVTSNLIKKETIEEVKE